IDLTPGWPRLPMHEAVKQYTGLDFMTVTSDEEAVAAAKSIGVELPATADISLNYPTESTLLTIDTPWNVTLTPMVGKPRRLRFDTLHDLTLDPDSAVRHFSGTVSYSNSFRLKEIPAGKRVALDLGDLREMARVRINGQEAGGLWTAPYSLDITPLLRKGKNTVDIELVTTWVNRLVADASLPENERQTWYYYHSISPSTPLQSSGLLRPARLTVAEY
ncbi:MAG: hypothetical protein K2L62_01320, partial [Muribaculaceae bacterium]|nr:hypothetical protein [Muribaculaceae bacterium]